MQVVEKADGVGLCHKHGGLAPFRFLRLVAVDVREPFVERLLGQPVHAPSLGCEVAQQLVPALAFGLVVGTVGIGVEDVRAADVPLGPEERVVC